MTANFTITDAELEAIRSVERFFGKKMQEDFLAPSIPHGLHEATVARRCILVKHCVGTATSPLLRPVSLPTSSAQGDVRPFPWLHIREQLDWPY